MLQVGQDTELAGETPTHPVLVHTQVCPEFLPLGYISSDISSHLPIPFYNQNGWENVKKIIHTLWGAVRRQPLFLPIPVLSNIRPTPIPVLSGNKALGKVERWNHSSRQDFAHTLSWASNYRDFINYGTAELINSKYNMYWKMRVTQVLLKTLHICICTGRYNDFTHFLDKKTSAERINHSQIDTGGK